MRFVEASIDRLPFDDGSFDVVISNGVINLSPVKQRVFAEAARVLRPGGRPPPGGATTTASRAIARSPPAARTASRA